MRDQVVKEMDVLEIIYESELDSTGLSEITLELVSIHNSLFLTYFLHKHFDWNQLSVGSDNR